MRGLEVKDTEFPLQSFIFFYPYVAGESEDGDSTYVLWSEKAELPYFYSIAELEHFQTHFNQGMLGGLVLTQVVYLRFESAKVTNALTAPLVYSDAALLEAFVTSLESNVRCRQRGASFVLAEQLSILSSLMVS